MKKAILSLVLLYFFSSFCIAQATFSNETKKYIAYNSPITVFKDALLIDGLGRLSHIKPLLLKMAK